jgi:hypothetical protein
MLQAKGNVLLEGEAGNASVEEWCDADGRENRNGVMLMEGKTGMV